MKILLPKALPHVRSGLEHRHHREVNAAAVAMPHKRVEKTKRVETPTGSCLQTSVMHSSGGVVVRTYNDGMTETIEGSVE